MKKVIEQRGNITVTRETDSDGYLAVTTWRDKVKHGAYKLYYPDGSIFIDLNCKNGVIDGMDKTFWSDKSMDFWNRKDGKLNGIYVKISK